MFKFLSNCKENIFVIILWIVPGLVINFALVTGLRCGSSCRIGLGCFAMLIIGTFKDLFLLFLFCGISSLFGYVDLVIKCYTLIFCFGYLSGYLLLLFNDQDS